MWLEKSVRQSLVVGFEVVKTSSYIARKLWKKQHKKWPLAVVRKKTFYFIVLIQAENCKMFLNNCS